MSFWSRITNTFRGDRLTREIDEELQAHLADAIEQGRDPAEARRAFGSPLQFREASRDLRLIAWLEGLRADAVFGWRQLAGRKVTSTAAVLSLALAIGASTAAFRLIDALLLRPLPVAEPWQLYALARAGVGFDGRPQTFDGWAYPDFTLMRAAVKGQAELIAVSYAVRDDLTYGADDDMEKACVQYVSGWMFDSFGLRPAAGRLFTDSDDQKPGAHPFAVLSYDYWSRRFARDPRVLGRTFRVGDRLFEIVGVGPKAFTGTETGTVTDIFLPTMMNPAVVRDDTTWLRTLARVYPGNAMEPLRARLDATSRAFERQRARGFTGMTKQVIGRFINNTVVMEPAEAGFSDLQEQYRRGLLVGAVLVALVLLIACANVANLMIAHAAARAREMALRVSIGAGRWRLAQLVMVESALLAALAACVGAVFAGWAAPFVVGRISAPGNPVWLPLPADWRVVAFGAVLTLLVTALLGLAPALRASATRPASALKGGENPHSRRRLMQVLVAAQTAFCMLVLFVAGLFVATFERLAHQPLGFSADRLLTLTVIPAQPQSPEAWEQVAARLREVPGVEKVALAGWPLLTRNSTNSFISINGAPPGPVLAYFLPVSPGWLDTMRIPLLEGRDFRPEDTAPGVAIVNQTFVRQFLHDESALGKTFARGNRRFEIAGIVPDSPYRSLHEPIFPVAYLPFRTLDQNGKVQPVGHAAILVRTASPNPLALASTMRRAVAAARPGFRVSETGTEAEAVRGQTIRERLLATLALFFSGVALVLAGIGLYGVLDYSVLARRREIGIRMAVGARPGDIARRLTAEVFRMVAAGALAGLALGALAGRYLESLLYQVKPGDPVMLALPSLAILAVALIAALPAVFHAVQIDPVAMLRAD
jgi:putative ABC transport system permease protein